MEGAAERPGARSAPGAQAAGGSAPASAEPAAREDATSSPDERSRQDPARDAAPHWLRGELERCVRELAAIERPSASRGELQAAEWIAQRLRGHGLQPEIEDERAHGGYWWPIGTLNAAAGLAALARRRRRTRVSSAGALLAGAFAAAAIADDVGAGRQWFRRVAMPKRSTFNVLAQAGAAGAPQTVLIVAHHDAAHSGLVFHPALPRLAAAAAPGLHERSNQSFPIMYLTWLGPVLGALGALIGSRRALAAGALLGLGSAAAMADIGRAAVVPGANDNLSAVAVLLAIARRLQERPPEGVRVLLLSTGSEESFMEGMQGFMRRHAAELDPQRTTVLCLECLGSPSLTVLEGEGMLRMRLYPSHLREALADAAEEAGVQIARGLRTVAATDALVALRRGLPAVTLASVDETKFPANYHWPSDTPENISWQTVQDAFAVTERFVRRAGGACDAPA